MTCSPTRIASELDIRATRMAFVTRSSCRSETSAAALAERSVARTTSPPMPSTVISSMPLTTWAAVITRPSLPIRTPESVSVKRVTPSALTSRPLARTTMTVGLALREDLVQVLGLGRRDEGRQQGGREEYQYEEIRHGSLQVRVRITRGTEWHCA